MHHFFIKQNNHISEISPVHEDGVQIIGTKSAYNNQISKISEEFWFHIQVSNIHFLLFLGIKVFKKMLFAT